MLKGTFKHVTSTIFILFLIVQLYPLKVIPQIKEGFEVVEGTNTLEVAYWEMGIEKFRIVINKNGGLSQVLISRIPYVSVAGMYVFGFWEQTWNSDPVESPLISRSDNYVKIRFYGKYRGANIYVETNYTISKIGLITISSVMEAKEDELDVRVTGWSIYFPVEIFGGGKAYVSTSKGIKEIVLPESLETNSLFSTQETIYWVDFSKPTEGVTLINMAPGSKIWYEAGINDERQWGYHNVYSIVLAHTPHGGGAMPKGEKRFSKVALYIHGPGGYEENKRIIDLTVEIAGTYVECENYLAKYETGSKAWMLSSQAMGILNSSFEKLFGGDEDGAIAEFENAKTLLKQVREEVIIPLHLIALVIIIVIIIVIFVLRVRKKIKG